MSDLWPTKVIIMREKVALLGSSGIVSQRFQQRLANHPWFELSAVFGTQKNAGKSLDELTWNLPEPRPELPNIEVISCSASDLNFELDKLNIQLVFSALPTTEAKEIEPILRQGGKHVFSNSAAHRMDNDVPLVIPEINPEHLGLLDGQKSTNQGGSITCSTNCTVMPITIPLKPIAKQFGITSLEVQSEQSLSGGGWLMMADAKKTGEVSSEIPGEAEKIAEEIVLLLGEFNGDNVTIAKFSTDISCRRVMRNYGHLVRVKVELSKNTTEEEILALLNNFTSIPQQLELPSAPRQPIIVINSTIQPSVHQWAGAESITNPDPAVDLRCGMAVVISDLQVSDNHVSFNAFSENTIRGAAGGCLLLAELAFKQGLLV
jgi:aspartate-semialdehyde dehydrogenase